MAVAFVAAASSNVAVAATSTTMSINIGSAANRAVIVACATLTDTTGMTANIGGVNLPVIAGTDGGVTTATVLLGGATTLTGLQTVTVSWTTAQTGQFGVVAASGVDPTTPVNNGVFTSTASSPISQTVTSTAGDLTVTTADGSATPQVTPTTTQTGQWTGTFGALIGAGGDTGPGTASPVHTWSMTGTVTFMGLSGANFNQAALGAAGPTFDHYYRTMRQGGA